VAVLLQEDLVVGLQDELFAAVAEEERLRAGLDLDEILEGGRGVSFDPLFERVVEDDASLGLGELWRVDLADLAQHALVGVHWYLNLLSWQTIA
jgi:hypothetical protein